ncbi:MAG TPA: hypothetical protein VFS00_34060, partial [Polyangiaceae bacterium]|nr:hypothetical protein [Polyangiaceae bacterium]
MAWAASGCSAGPPGSAGRPADRGAASRPLEGALVAGCRAVVRGALCEVDEGAVLRVWSPAAVTRWATTSGAPAAGEAPLAVPEGERVGDGVLYRVALPAGARGLRLAAGGPEGERSARVELAPAPAPPAALTRARSQRAEGELGAAAATLREAIAAGAGAGARAGTGAGAAGAGAGGEGPFLLSALGRVELARGEWQSAEEVLAQASAGHEAAGRGSAAADDEVVRAFSLRARHQFVEARAALGRVVALSAGYPEGVAEATFHRGLIAWEAGDARAALRETADAQAQFERVGLARPASLVTQQRVQFLTELGRGEESIGVLQGLAAKPAEDELPCDRADLAINLSSAAATLAQVASELGRAPPLDPVPLAERARAEVARLCPEPRRLAYALTGASLAALYARDAAGAREALRGARAALPDPGTALALEWLGIEARAALVAGDAAGALALAARLGAEAAAAGEARER